MSQNAGLSGTIDKIITKTEGGIVSDLDKFLQEAQSSLEGSRTTIEGEYDLIVENGKKEAEKIEKQIVGSSNLDARNKQITLVEEAISSVFDRALDRLRSSNADPTLLKSIIKEAADALGTTKIMVRASSKDAQAVKASLADFDGAEFDPKPVECLGGIIARSKDNNMSFNNTLDARFDRLKPLIRKAIASKFRLD